MRLRVFIATLFLLGAVVVAAPGRAEAKQKLAVLGVEADDGDKNSADTTANLARWVTQGLRARALKSTGKFDVPASASKDLAEMKLLTDCLDEKVECMAQMGKDLGVDRMVYGKLSKTKSGWTLTLRYLNVGSRSLDGKPVEKQLAQADASEDAAKRVAAAAFAELTGTAAAGSIEIQANVDTGTVYIDGSARGVIAGRAASIPELTDGTYTIAIESTGHKRWEKTVTVKSGDPTLVQAELEAEGLGDGDGGGDVVGGGGGDGGSDEGGARPGGAARGLFWTSLVLTAGGVTAFTITGLKVRDYEDEKTAAIIEGNKTKEFTADASTDACQKADMENYAPVQGPCDDGKQMATVTNVLIGVTAVAAVAAGYFYYKGYIAADRSSKDSAAAKKKRGPRAANSGGTVVVTPQVYSNGAGLGAVITF